jgi:prepilin-type N-terminal cleavage/methylation domain-containing protein
MQTNNRRRGVTLIELMIALSISGLALLGMIMLLDQLNDSGGRIATDSAVDATAGNGDRFLRRLLVDARSATDSTKQFRGDERTASYLTLCDTPDGWAEVCRATLAIDSLSDTSAIIAQTDRGDQHVVRRMGGVARFRYLDLTSHDSAWVRSWTPSIVLPGAIAIVNGTDTTIFPLGATRD